MGVAIYKYCLPSIRIPLSTLYTSFHITFTTLESNNHYLLFWDTNYGDFERLSKLFKITDWKAGT